MSAETERLASPLFNDPDPNFGPPKERRVPYELARQADSILEGVSEGVPRLEESFVFQIAALGSSTS